MESTFYLRSERLGILFALLTAVTTGFFNVFIKKGMEKSNGESIGFVITIFINVVIQAFIFIIFFFQRSNVEFSWTATGWFILGGLLSTILGRFALLSSIKNINPSRASALKNTTPVFTVLYAILVLGESFTLLSIFGLLLILLAIIIQGITYFIDSTRIKNHLDIKTNWSGYLLGIFAAVIFGLGQGIRKQGLIISNEPLFGALIGSFISLLLIIVYQAFRGNLKTIILSNYRVLNTEFIIASIFLSFGPIFFFLSASLIQVSFASVIAGIEPLITILLSILFFKGKENITFSLWIQAFLVMIGLTLIYLG
jgi:drug/metabolite transporter (DMT)-like permease